ncbi:MAG TPA: DUF4349 domain-containing protein, partial [Streptosporangiaceae bacterium]|nr:DUF4349 domain-containing protein [Streptosporangiaceae bacterium]
MNRRSARARRARFVAAAGVGLGGVMLAGGMLLAGCSATSASSAASASGVAAPTAEALAPGAGAPGSRAANSANGQPANAGTTARLAPGSDIIYTAQLTVRAANVSSAAARAAQITEGAGGYVSNETTSADPDHPSQAIASVQLKIPVASYPAILGQLAGGLGTQLSLQEQAQDVTQQVADVNSQVTSDQAAIAQLRGLLRQAGSVSQLLSIQDQIASQESAL